MNERAITRLEIKGYKSIKNLDFKLGSLNVLIGANGAGKSNFISLFQLINEIVKKNLQLFVKQSGGIDSLLYFSQKVTSELVVKLYFGQNGYEFTLIPTRENTLIFSLENCSFYGHGNEKPPFMTFLGKGHEETMLHEKANKGNNVALYVLKAVKDWKIYHFHDTSDTSKIKALGKISDNFNLRPDASNLAAFLFLLKKKHPQNYRNIVDTICLVAPFFDDFVLRPDPVNNNLIQLEWKERGSDAYFNAHSFSDGTLRFICLATLLLQPELPSTVLLDEPELGLHPYAITLLASLLKSAAAKTQVIVSTQSVTLVNQFKPEDIIVVDREAEGSVFKDLRNEDMGNWLEEYEVGDLWEKNIIGGRPTNG